RVLEKGSLSGVGFVSEDRGATTDLPGHTTCSAVRPFHRQSVRAVRPDSGGLYLSQARTMALFQCPPDLGRQRRERRVGTLPLDCRGIVDPAVLLAAPFATTMLADFGAEVIKVEMPGTGDPFARWGRNKKSVTCDLRQPEGQELFKRLVSTADVV